MAEKSSYNVDNGAAPIGSLGPFGDNSFEAGEAPEDGNHSQVLESSSVFVHAVMPGHMGTAMMPSSGTYPGVLSTPAGITSAMLHSSPTSDISPAAVEAISKSGVDAFIDPLNLLLDPTTHRLAQEIDAMPEDEPILQGFLRKEGTTRGSWKRRWFILRRHRLDYYKKQDSEEPQGNIPIDSLVGISCNVMSYPQPHAFQLITVGRTYALQAPLDAAQRHWLSAIAATVYHRMQQHVTAFAPPETVYEDVHPGNYTDAPTLSALADMDDGQKWASPPREPDNEAGNVTMAGDKLKHVLENLLLENKRGSKDYSGDAQSEEVSKALEIMESLAQALTKTRKGESSGVHLPPKHAAPRQNAKAASTTAKKRASPRQRSNSASELTLSRDRETLLAQDLTALSDLPGNVVVHVEVEESYGNKSSSRKAQDLHAERRTHSVAKELSQTKHRPPSDTVRKVSKPQTTSISEPATAQASRTTSRRPSSSAMSQSSDQAKPAAPARVVRPSKFRVEYSKLWINSLKLGENIPIGPASKCAPYFRDGVMLCALLEAVDAVPRMEGVNSRPRARAACMNNIEKALQVLWKTRIKHSKIPSAEDIFDAKEDKMLAFLPELLEAFAYRPARVHAEAYLSWLQSIFALFQLPVIVETSEFCGWHHLADIFKDGAIFVVLASLYCDGFLEGLAGKDVWAFPKSGAQRHANWSAAQSTLHAAGVPILVPHNLVIATPDDWAVEEDEDFALLQLQALYHALNDRRYALPVLGTVDSLSEASKYQGGIICIRNGRQMTQQVYGLPFRDFATADVPASPIRSETLHASPVKADSAPRVPPGSVPPSPARTLPQPVSPARAAQNVLTFDEVLAERNRLYEIALERAAGNRMRSSAVHAVAKKWADNKVTLWARTLQVPETIIERAVASNTEASTVPSPQHAAAQAPPKTLLSPTAHIYAPSAALARVDTLGVVASTERVMMAREEKRSWELLHQRQREAVIPPRGGLFAVSIRTQPLTVTDTHAAEQAMPAGYAAPRSDRLPRALDFSWAQLRPGEPGYNNSSSNSGSTAAVATTDNKAVTNGNSQLAAATTTSNTAGETRSQQTKAAAATTASGYLAVAGAHVAGNGDVMHASPNTVVQQAYATPASTTAPKHYDAAVVEEKHKRSAASVQADGRGGDVGLQKYSLVGLKVRALVKQYAVDLQSCMLVWGVLSDPATIRQEGIVDLRDVVSASVRDVDGEPCLTLRIAPNNLQALRSSNGLATLEFVPNGATRDAARVLNEFANRVMLEWQNTKHPFASLHAPPPSAVHVSQTATVHAPSTSIATTAEISSAVASASDYKAAPFPTKPALPTSAPAQTPSPFTAPVTASVPAQTASPFTAPVTTNTTTASSGVKFELKSLQQRSAQGGMLASFLASRGKL